MLVGFAVPASLAQRERGRVGGADGVEVVEGGVELAVSNDFSDEWHGGDSLFGLVRILFGLVRMSEVPELARTTPNGPFEPGLLLVLSMKGPIYPENGPLFSSGSPVCYSPFNFRTSTFVLRPSNWPLHDSLFTLQMSVWPLSGAH